MITRDDPRYEAGQKVIDAMHEFFALSSHGGAVQWLEDTDGRVVVFTRGEYRQQLMNAVLDARHEAERPTVFFELDRPEKYEE